MDFRVRGEGVVTAELRNVVLEKTEVRGDSRCEFRRRFGKKIKKECGQCNTGGLPTVASQYTEGARSQDSEARFLMMNKGFDLLYTSCLLYTSPSPRDLSTSRMPSSA